MLRIDREHLLKAIAAFGSLAHHRRHPQPANFVLRVGLKGLDKQRIGTVMITRIEGANAVCNKCVDLLIRHIKPPVRIGCYDLHSPVYANRADGAN